ncbi:MAG: FHA domain-containing protein [Alphaproteobacteria bacterium]|nr:FHA domain-containing protein [Alphaproteobacteria bacterium]
MLRLRFEDGAEPGRQVALTATTRIGRDPERCAVVVAANDDTVSREHAVLTRRGGRWWIDDLGSARGTFVDGRRVCSPTEVPDGATLTLGDLTLTVALTAPTSAPARGRSVALTAGLAVVGLTGIVTAGGWRASATTVDAATPLPTPSPPASALPEAGSTRRDAGRHALAEPPFPAAVRALVSDLSGAPSACPIPELFLQDVQDELVAVLSSGRDTCRVRQWQPVVAAHLEDLARAEGKPVSRARALSWLPWVESRYEPAQACSVAGARGMWQFLPATARTFDLVVGPGRDDRCDWSASTTAAWHYLDRLFDRCGDDHPLLAIAGYNTGGGRSCAHVDTDAVCGGWDFRPFYERGTLHAETTEYVPRFVASWLLGEHPELALTIARERVPDLLPLPTCDADGFVPPPPVACSTGPEQCPDRRGAEAG